MRVSDTGVGIPAAWDVVAMLARELQARREARAEVVDKAPTGAPESVLSLRGFAGCLWETCGCFTLQVFWIIDRCVRLRHLK